MAAFIALGLCIPLVVAGFAARVLFWRGMWNRMNDRGRGPKLPPGRNPYHLP